jgi:hypothetical protein
MKNSAHTGQRLNRRASCPTIGVSDTVKISSVARESGNFAPCDCDALGLSWYWDG